MKKLIAYSLTLILLVTTTIISASAIETKEPLISIRQVIGIGSELILPIYTNKQEDITWSSTNTEILSVTNGLAVAKASGNVTLKCKVGHMTIRIKYTVNGDNPRTTRLAVNTDKGLRIYTVFDLKDKAYFTYTLSNSKEKVTWKRNGTKILGLTSTGTVTAKAVGKSYLAATTKSGLKETAYIRVVEKYDDILDIVKQINTVIALVSKSDQVSYSDYGESIIDYLTAEHVLKTEDGSYIIKGYNDTKWTIEILVRSNNTYSINYRKQFKYMPEADLIQEWIKPTKTYSGNIFAVEVSEAQKNESRNVIPTNVVCGLFTEMETNKDFYEISVEGEIQADQKDVGQSTVW